MKKYMVKQALLLLIPMAEEFVKKTSNPYDDLLVKGLKAMLEDL